MKDICEALKIPILVPEVALQEWISNYKKNFVSAINRIEEGEKSINKFLNEGVQITWKKEKDAMLSEVDAYIRRKIKETGLEIIKTPQIDFDLLIKMSIDKIRPFEEKGEKGFRDSIILFSILEYAKKSNGGTHLLLAEDKAYDHKDVHDRALSYKVKFVIADSVSNATDLIKEFLSHSAKQYQETRVSKLKDFLYGNKEKIDSYIRTKGEISIGGFFTEFGYGIVKKITSVELLEINKPTPGVLPKGVDTGRVKISFSVKLRFSIFIRRPAQVGLLRMITGPRFRLQEETGAWEREEQEYEQTTPQYYEGEEPIERWVLVEASVELDKDDKYSNLQIENISL